MDGSDRPLPTLPAPAALLVVTPGELAAALEHLREEIRSRELHANHADRHRAGGGDVLTIPAGVGQAAASGKFVTYAADAGLTNNRVATAGNGIGITDAGADDGALTIGLGNLTADWTQAGVFNISTAGNLIVLKHMAIGATGFVSATQIVNMAETIANRNARGLALDLTASAGGTPGTVLGLQFAVHMAHAAGLQTVAGGVRGTFSYEGAGGLVLAYGALSGGQSTGAGVGPLTEWDAYIADIASWVGSSPVTSRVLNGFDQGGAGTTTAYGLNILAQTGAEAHSFIADALVLGRDLSHVGLLDVYGVLTVKPPSGGAASALRLYEADASGTNYVGLRALAAMAGNLTFTLPGADGARGQALVTDGAGNLSFADPDAEAVDYWPDDEGDWIDPPLTAAEALDELAERTADLEVVGQYAPRTFIWTPDAAPQGAVTAGNQQGNIYHSGPDGCIAETLYVDCETAPGASGLPITIQYGDTNSLDTVATWTQLATITLSSVKSGYTTVNLSVPANVLLRMNVGTIVGSPADVNVSLETRAVFRT